MNINLKMVRVLASLSDKKEPPKIDVERFLAMLRSDSREKLKDLPIDSGIRCAF